MKVLKYIFILLLIIVGLFLIYAFLQPNSYDIKRERVIEAPASAIFNNLNDYKNWQDWGPWMEQDTTIVATYPEQTSGVGASYSWTSKDGPGKMKTLSLEPNKTLVQELQFADYEPTTVYWDLEETNNKSTKVTWGMKSDKNPFIFKLFAAMSGGMNNMLGPMEERGLERLDSVIQADLKVKAIENAFRLGKIETITLDNQHFIGYPVKAKTDDLEGMMQLFSTYMPKVGQYAAANNISSDDMLPAAVYKSWDMETGETEFLIGLILKDKLNPDKGMETITLPKGNALKLSKYGYYGNGDMEAHEAIAKHLNENNIESSLVWETYVNDPETVKRQDVQTDIYYAIK